MKHFLGSLLIILSIHAHAQQAVRKGMSGGFDVGLAFKNNYINPSITYFELISISKSNTFFIG